MIHVAYAYFVENGWFDNVSVNSLVKGHTKNSCDCNFNLLKLQWYNSTIYTWAQTL